MLRIEIKQEVIMTNKEIANFLYADGRLIEYMGNVLEDMLYDRYKMDYEDRCYAVTTLTKTDYAQILRHLADRMEGITDIPF